MPACLIGQGAGKEDLVGRKKRSAKLQADKEFAKTFFAAKSKRSADKKVAYKKRHAKK